MTPERMELWSDETFSEFAIKFNSTIVVYTSSNPDMVVRMIHECPYKAGYDFDWHYTLSQWVVYYLANKYTVLLDSKLSKQKEFNIRDDEHDEVDTSLYTRH